MERLLSGTCFNVALEVEMQINLEQRYAIKFCVKLENSATETLAMIEKAYGNDALSKAQVFRWHKTFKEGREDVEDEQRSGRPSTAHTLDNVAKVRAALNTDRRLSVRLIADKVELPKSIVHEIITTELQMRKICAKLVPKVLTDDQKENRVSISRELLHRVGSEPGFLERVITGDESWVFEYDPETKRQSSEWHSPGSPRPRKARMSKSRIKSMLIVFFDSKGVVHKEFLPPGQTINAAFYLEVLKRLRNRVARVRPEIANNWILHHDNAPSHGSMLVKEFLAKQMVPTLPQPPYSPDLAPADFFLFPRLKSHLKGHHFGTVENVQAAVTSVLKDIHVQEFQASFRAWQSRWQRCIDARGCYFEDF